MNEEIILNVESYNPYVIGAVAYVEQLENGAKITIVDKNGTTTATVEDGKDGKSISSIVLNDNYTLTINYEDGSSTTTGSIRGATGASGVFYGEEEPIDPAINVWVDPADGDGSVLKIRDEDDQWTTIESIVGEPAGFGTVTATVDANHGTPAVTVTTSGDDTAKNFAFAFSNLQPAPYDDSELQADFAVLQGQFDTAVAAVTTDTEVTDIRVGADGITDTTAGASVRRQFSALKSELNLMTGDTVDGVTFLNLWMINGSGKWQKSSSNWSTMIRVSEGDSVEITPNGHHPTYYTMLDGVPTLKDYASANFATGYSGIIAVSVKTTITVPSDAPFMWISGTPTYAPNKILVNGYDISVSLKDKMLANTASIDDLEDDVEIIDNRLEVIEEKEIKYASLTNLLTNGDFHTAGSPLMYENCTGAVSDGVLTVTGNGGGSQIKTSYYYPISDVATNQYYVALWIKANSANCKSIQLRVAGGLGTNTIIKPVANKWYMLSAKYLSDITGDTNLIYSIWADYANATAENGESISIKQAVAFMINYDFGIGVAPPLYKLNSIIEKNGFWLGAKNAVVWEAESAITEIPGQKWSFGQKHRPIVTFVDDDGWQRVYDELCPISEKYGVPFVSAIQINSTIHDWNALYLQNELGWELAVHPDCGQAGGLATLETEEEIEQWMVDTNNYLDARGFKWKNVVYANGEPDERVRRIAKKYYRCGACGSRAMVNHNVIANFEIQRVAIGYPFDSEWNTFANLKTYIDQAVADNGWCIFMLHTGMTSYHTSETTELVDQLVDYCVNTLEIEVMTLNDGFNVFGNAIECGDYVGRNAYNGDDETRGIAISQTGELGNIVNRRTLDNLISTLGTAIGRTITATYNESTGAYEFEFSS